VFLGDDIQKLVGDARQEPDSGGQRCQARCRNYAEPYLQVSEAVLSPKPESNSKAAAFASKRKFGQEFCRSIQQVCNLLEVRSKLSQVFKSELATLGLDSAEHLFVLAQSAIHLVEVLVTDWKKIIDLQRVRGFRAGVPPKEDDKANEEKKSNGNKEKQAGHDCSP